MDGTANPASATALRTALAIAPLAALLLVAGPAAAGHWDPGGDFDDGDIRDLPDGENLLSEGADQKIFPPEHHRASNLRFGTAVDANGGADTLGHTFAASGPDGSDGGTVFIYKSNASTDGWSFTNAISVDVEGSEQAVSIDGDTLAVARPGYGDILVYKRVSSGEWTQTADLDRLAWNVEVSGDLITWSYPFDDGSTADFEPQYGIFERSGTGDWSEVVYEFPSAEGVVTRAVGVQEGVNSTTQSRAIFAGEGVVEVWEKDLVAGTWSNTEDITSCGPDGDCSDTVGEAADLAPTTEDKIALGAPDLNNQVGRGYTYVNTEGTYAFSGTLEAPDTDDDYNLGADVNAWDGSSVAGAPYADQSHVSDQGVVFAYEDGLRKGKIQQADPEGDKFGSAVHYTGEWSLVGAPQEDEFGYTDLGYVGYFK